MAQQLPIVLVPGLGCSARFYAPQINALWVHGTVTVADHRRDDTMADIAKRILADAPPHFALAGLSMGGYIAFAMLRQAPERIARLALLDTSARPDRPEQTADREKLIAMAQAGRFAEVTETLLPRYIHPQPIRRRSAQADRARHGRRHRRRGLCASGARHHAASGFAPAACGDQLSDAGAGG